jgi:hypothetical protein
MRLDQRLREELRSSASVVTDDLDTRWQSVITTARRRRRNRRLALAVAAVVIVVIAAWIIPGGIRVLQNSSETGPADGPPGIFTPTPPPAGGANVIGRLAGTYSVTLDDSEDLVPGYRLAGTYVLRLQGDGSAFLKVPAKFKKDLWEPHDVFYSVRGERMTIRFPDWINYCHPVAPDYEWTLERERLTFRSLTDGRCHFRRTILTTHPWKRVQGD